MKSVRKLQEELSIIENIRTGYFAYGDVENGMRDLTWLKRQAEETKDRISRAVDEEPNLCLVCLSEGVKIERGEAIYAKTNLSSLEDCTIIEIDQTGYLPDEICAFLDEDGNVVIQNNIKSSGKDALTDFLLNIITNGDRCYYMAKGTIIGIAHIEPELKKSSVKNLISSSGRVGEVKN